MQQMHALQEVGYFSYSGTNNDEERLYTRSLFLMALNDGVRHLKAHGVRDGLTPLLYVTFVTLDVVLSLDEELPFVGVICMLARMSGLPSLSAFYKSYVKHVPIMRSRECGAHVERLLGEMCTANGCRTIGQLKLAVLNDFLLRNMWYCAVNGPAERCTDVFEWEGLSDMRWDDNPFRCVHYSLPGQSFAFDYKVYCKQRRAVDILRRILDGTLKERHEAGAVIEDAPPGTVFGTIHARQWSTKVDDLHRFGQTFVEALTKDLSDAEKRLRNIGTRIELEEGMKGFYE
jgi:hypothetical protein